MKANPKDEKTKSKGREGDKWLDRNDGEPQTLDDEHGGILHEDRPCTSFTGGTEGKNERKGKERHGTKSFAC